MQLVVSAIVVGLWVAAGGLQPAWGGEWSMRSDPRAQYMVQQYLNDVAAVGERPGYQGVWLQSERGVLAHHQGTALLPAASLTKIATTLAALRAWGPAYQFITLAYALGPVQGGVLRGDLVVQGAGDPLFVSEDGVALAHALNQVGIKRVTGNLVIAGEFYMNFISQPLRAGKVLKQLFQEKAWPEHTRAYYPAGTPKPEIFIAGTVAVMDLMPFRPTPLVRHRSLSLSQILKRMNIYSSNAMATMVTESLGGTENMIQLASLAAGVPLVELQLINGTGLGPQNQLSPQTVCALLIGIHKALQPTKLTIADVFPVAGLDQGTIRRRNLPLTAVVKTGTLRNVSTLAGVIFTQEHGPVWFALFNQGNHLHGFRAQQDALLNNLIQIWGPPMSLPADFMPTQPPHSWTNSSRDDLLIRTKATGG